MKQRPGGDLVDLLATHIVSLSADAEKPVDAIGVAVPGMDGRAGMASLVVDGDFRLDRLPGDLQHRLAPYARPIFLRLSPRIDVTGTFKQRKVDVVREGFDPSAIADPLYVMDYDTGGYERLTPERYANIIAGKIQF